MTTGATVPKPAGGGTTQQNYLDVAAAWRYVMQLRQRPQGDVFAFIEPLGAEKRDVGDATHWRLCVVPTTLMKGGLSAQDVDRKATHIHNDQQFYAYLQTLDGGGATAPIVGGAITGSDAVVGDDQAGRSGGRGANT